MSEARKGLVRGPDLQKPAGPDLFSYPTRCHNTFQNHAIPRLWKAEVHQGHGAARLLTPVDTSPATFIATVAVSLAAVPALVIAVRWWKRPALRCARPLALIGGLLLPLGISSLWGVAGSPAEDAATGLLVCGVWLIWGAAVLATAGRISPALRVRRA